MKLKKLSKSTMGPTLECVDKLDGKARGTISWQPNGWTLWWDNAKLYETVGIADMCEFLEMSDSPIQITLVGNKFKLL